MRRLFIVALFIGGFCFSSHTHSPAVDQVASTSRHVLDVVSLASVKNADAHGAVLTGANFDQVVLALYDTIGLSGYDLKFEIFRKAMIGYYNLVKQGALANHRLLTIINFELPGTAKRFYMIDLVDRSVKYHTYVAHGRNTGENFAAKFSNTPNSNQSSLGFYVTAESYYGSKGYSLRLDGQEELFNSNIRTRAVVIHGAEYATESWISRYGRLGRSQGCPALPPHLNREVIDKIKGGTAIFTYFPDDDYLNASSFLKTERLFEKLNEQPVELATVIGA